MLPLSVDQSGRYIEAVEEAADGSMVTGSFVARPAAWLRGERSTRQMRSRAAVEPPTNSPATEALSHSHGSVTHTAQSLTRLRRKRAVRGRGSSSVERRHHITGEALEDCEVVGRVDHQDEVGEPGIKVGPGGGTHVVG
jgi:hypothetical protein